jgi:hypothetical protein
VIYWLLIGNLIMPIADVNKNWLLSQKTFKLKFFKKLPKLSFQKHFKMIYTSTDPINLLMTKYYSNHEVKRKRNSHLIE